METRKIEARKRIVFWYKLVILSLFVLLTTSHFNLSFAITRSSEIDSESNLYNNVQISILTCSPGDELYSTFGHTALRVKDRSGSRDFVYNFGLFDFSTPNFYMKFIRGRLNYMLGIQLYGDFIMQYKWENKMVEEQVLSLTSGQKELLISKLNTLYLPQNRFYLYEFLTRNCTSQVRDILYEIVEVSSPNFSEYTGLSYRDNLNNYITGWTKFGINIILGSGVDREISRFQEMFLPNNFRDGLNSTVVNGASFVKKRRVLLDVDQSKIEERGFSITRIVSPLLLSILLFVLSLFYFFKKRPSAHFNQIVISICSLVGLFLITVISISDHSELYYNYNLLFFNPIFLLVAVSTYKNWFKLERALSLISIFFIASIYFVWLIDIQYMEISFVFITLSLFVIFLSKCIYRR